MICAAQHLAFLTFLRSGGCVALQQSAGAERLPALCRAVLESVSYGTEVSRMEKGVQ